MKIVLDTEKYVVRVYPDDGIVRRYVEKGVTVEAFNDCDAAPGVAEETELNPSMTFIKTCSI
jgi:DNA-binding transcriptional regulator of glucitol operon